MFLGGMTELHNQGSEPREGCLLLSASFLSTSFAHLCLYLLSPSASCLLTKTPISNMSASSIRIPFCNSMVSNLERPTLEGLDESDGKTSVGSEEESYPFLDSSRAPETSYAHWQLEPRNRRRPSWLVCIITSILAALLSSGSTAGVLRKLNDGQCQHMKGRLLLDRRLPAGSPLLEIDRTVKTEIFRPWNFTPSVWNEHPSLGRVDKLWDEKAGVKSKQP